MTHLGDAPLGWSAGGCYGGSAGREGGDGGDGGNGGCVDGRGAARAATSAAEGRASQPLPSKILHKTLAVVLRHHPLHSEL